jgi:hypothetical protein
MVSEVSVHGYLVPLPWACGKATHHAGTYDRETAHLTVAGKQRERGKGGARALISLTEAHPVTKLLPVGLPA